MHPYITVPTSRFQLADGQLLLCGLVAASDLLVFALSADGDVGLGGASLAGFLHLVGVTALLFLGADLVQDAFGVRPEDHFVGRLFDHWLRLSRNSKAISEKSNQELPCPLP